MYKKILALAATLALASGCQSTAQPTHYSQLVIGPKAGSYLQIESVQQGASGELLRAGVRLHNRSGFTQDLRYRFEWLDADGFEIRGLAARWELLEMKPQVSHSLDRVATSPRARDYRIHLFDKNTPARETTNGSTP